MPVRAFFACRSHSVCVRDSCESELISRELHATRTPLLTSAVVQKWFTGGSQAIHRWFIQQFRGISTLAPIFQHEWQKMKDKPSKVVNKPSQIATPPPPFVAKTAARALSFEWAALFFPLFFSTTSVRMKGTLRPLTNKTRPCPRFDAACAPGRRRRGVRRASTRRLINLKGQS